jgi:hypothetical protein
MGILKEFLLDRLSPVEVKGIGERMIFSLHLPLIKSPAKYI